MTLNTRLGGSAGLWGLAEATVFFIVPDVLLSATALRHRRPALIACAWATVGALVGGVAMYLWGRADATGAAAFLDRIPGIGPTMLDVVRASLDTHGLAALFLGPLTGTPYKLYAVAAGQTGAAFLPFLLVSLPARAIRFVLVVLLTHAIARRLPARLGPPILAVCWLAFYAAYFAHMGW